MSTPERQLSDIFDRFYESKGLVRVSFNNGAVYDLRISSTMHAEEGGDVVAHVVDVVERPLSGPVIDWSNAAMNFRLEDVKCVDEGGQCLFSRKGS